MAAFIESLQTENMQVAVLIAAHNAALVTANANERDKGEEYVRVFDAIYKGMTKTLGWTK